MDYSQFDDAALLRLIEKADANALNELYGRYSRLVYSVALHMVGEQATAEEIALDVFTKTWEKAETYRPDRGSVRVWLTGMTRNRAIDVIRHDKVRSNTQLKVWAAFAAEPKTIERKPEADVDLHIRKERVQSAINQLADDQRDLLALAYFQGYTQSQIAKLRNLPLGTVKTRIRAGIQRLRQLLEEDHFN